MYRVSRWSIILGRVSSHVPRNQAQFEREAKSLLKVVFWIAVLAPLILVPLYYLIVALAT
jgi:hypothetical protein